MQLKAVLAVLVLGFMAILPLTWAQSVGSFIGRRAYKKPDGDFCRITKINIDLCFPDLAAEGKDNLIQNSLQETGKSFCEMGMSWLWAPKRTLRKVVSVDNEELINVALTQDKGVILIAPHLGNWEVLNLYLSDKYPFTAMYRPPKLKLMDDLIKRMRARLGTRMAPADASGVRLVMKALKRGEMVGILPDQEPTTGGEFAPFFNQAAYSMKLLPQLVRQTGARVVCGYAERLPKGKGFKIHFIEPDQRLYDRDLEVALAGMNASVETCVQALPEQYQWEYKRFNNQPEGLVSPYRRK